MPIWMGKYLKEVKQGNDCFQIKNLEGETIKKVEKVPGLGSGYIYLCESGKRIFDGTGHELEGYHIREFIRDSEIFTDEELLMYDEAVMREKKEYKKRRCDEDKREFERLKKRLGEC